MIDWRDRISNSTPLIFTIMMERKGMSRNSGLKIYSKVEDLVHNLLATLVDFPDTEEETSMWSPPIVTLEDTSPWDQEALIPNPLPVNQAGKDYGEECRTIWGQAQIGMVVRPMATISSSPTHKIMHKNIAICKNIIKIQITTVNMVYIL